jgi:hypothetical protein
MKHVTYANKSLLMGDDAADMLVEYAAVLGANGSADNVTVHVLSVDGNEVDATFVLNSSSDLVAETTNSALDLPGNEAAVSYMRDAILKITSPPQAQPIALSEGAHSGPYVDDF